MVPFVLRYEFPTVDGDELFWSTASTKLLNVVFSENFSRAFLLVGRRKTAIVARLCVTKVVSRHMHVCLAVYVYFTFYQMFIPNLIHYYNYYSSY